MRILYASTCPGMGGQHCYAWFDSYCTLVQAKLKGTAARGCKWQLLTAWHSQQGVDLATVRVVLHQRLAV